MLVDELLDVPPDALLVSAEWAGRVGAVWPSGSTIGVDLSPLLDESLESCDGGQSTDVGGHDSPEPPPDVSPGGGHPEPAPKSPALVQSAPAGPATTTATGASTSTPALSAAAANLRCLTARGCPRRR